MLLIRLRHRVESKNHELAINESIIGLSVGLKRLFDSCFNLGCIISSKFKVLKLLGFDR